MLHLTFADIPIFSEAAMSKILDSILFGKFVSRIFENLAETESFHFEDIVALLESSPDLITKGAATTANTGYFSALLTGQPSTKEKTVTLEFTSRWRDTFGFTLDRYFEKAAETGSRGSNGRYEIIGAKAFTSVFDNVDHALAAALGQIQQNLGCVLHIGEPFTLQEVFGQV